MSLLFADNSTDNVDCTSNASLDNLDPGTIIWWGYWPSVANALRAQMGKVGTQSTIIFRRAGDGTTLRFQFGRSTTAFLHDSATGMLSANAWLCVAHSWDVASGGTSSWYRGTRTTSMSSVGGTPTVGSGTHDDSGGSLTVGLYTGLNSDAVRVATMAVFNRALSLAECNAWQFKPRVTSGCVGFWNFGYNGTNTQPDWSGNANNGTVTGATVADHVSIGPPFGYARRQSYIVAAAGAQGFHGALLGGVRNVQLGMLN